jgi:hypothetical protein
MGGSFDDPPKLQIDHAFQPIRSGDNAKQKLRGGKITKHDISPSS